MEGTKEKLCRLGAFLRYLGVEKKNREKISRPPKMVGADECEAFFIGRIW